MLQHLIIQFSFNYLSNGRLREIFSFKSGRGRSWEVVGYETFQI